MSIITTVIITVFSGLPCMFGIPLFGGMKLQLKTLNIILTHDSTSHKHGPESIYILFCIVIDQ